MSIVSTFVDDQPVELEIHDTVAGNEMIEDRKRLYAIADGFIICVAVDDRGSFDSVDRWENEIRLSNLNNLSQGIPIILLSTKKDLIQECEDPVMMHHLMSKHSISSTLYGVTETSAKDWEDQNVVQAFAKVTTACFKYKYPEYC